MLPWHCNSQIGEPYAESGTQLESLSLAKTPHRVIHATCDAISSYVIDSKCAPNFGEGQVRHILAERHVVFDLVVVSRHALGAAAHPHAAYSCARV